MQIWESEQKGDDKIIAFFNQTIYKANPKSTDVDRYILELKINSIPSAKALEIPLSYLREITMTESNNYLDVQFGSNSNEHFVITDDRTRSEIFGHFKAHLPVEEIVTKHSKFRVARKPLIAMAVIMLIFLWTLYVAIGVQNGRDYEVVGNYRSVAGIILMLAYLGVIKVIIIFGLLMAVAVISFIKKFKNPQTIHRLVVKR